MIFENVFEQVIYPNLKEHIEHTSIYNPLVTKAMPQESKRFPIVPIKLLSVRNKYNNLSYGEETYSFGIDINVYATDQADISKRTICDEITNVIVEYLKTNYHVTIRTELNAVNADASIHRNLIRVTGILDTKYGMNNLVIYPR